MTRSRLKTEQRLLEALASITLYEEYRADRLNALPTRAGRDRDLFHR